MSTNLFNFPAFFIILRESLECTLIITILISLIDRFVSEENQQKKNHKEKNMDRGWSWNNTFNNYRSSIFICISYN